MELDDTEEMLCRQTQEQKEIKEREEEHGEREKENEQKIQENMDLLEEYVSIRKKVEETRKEILRKEQEQAEMRAKIRRLQEICSLEEKELEKLHRARAYGGPYAQPYPSDFLRKDGKP